MGYAQVGYTYDDAQTADNTFDIKRIIFMANGQLSKQWSCFFMYDFSGGGKLHEIYTDYRFCPELTVRLGQFKTPYTVENLLSPTVVELINPYSQAVAYLAGINNTDRLYGGNAGRDIGISLYGSLFHQWVNYNFAVMNGQGQNTKDRNSYKDVIGNVMLNPTPWLSVGGSFIRGKGCAASICDINPDIKEGDNYTRNRWAVSTVIKTKPVHLRAEYLEGKDGQVKSRGYYATACVNNVVRQLDVVASYDFINRCRTLHDKETRYIAGLQYWFYPKCRLQAQYVYTDKRAGGCGNSIQTQVQVRF